MKREIITFRSHLSQPDTRGELACKENVQCTVSTPCSLIPLNSIKAGNIRKQIFSRAAALCILVLFFSGCSALIPVSRGAHNLNKGEVNTTVSYGIGGCNEDGRTHEIPSLPALLFGVGTEYGLNKTVNIGTEAWLSFGEVGLTINSYIQIRDHHTYPVALGINYGLTRTELEYYETYNMILTPDLIIGAGQFFFGIRRNTRITRFKIRSDWYSVLNVYDFSLGIESSHSSGRIFALTLSVDPQLDFYQLFFTLTRRKSRRH